MGMGEEYECFLSFISAVMKNATQMSVSILCRELDLLEQMNNCILAHKFHMLSCSFYAEENEFC